MSRFKSLETFLQKTGVAENASVLLNGKLQDQIFDLYHGVDALRNPDFKSITPLVAGALTAVLEKKEYQQLEGIAVVAGCWQEVAKKEKKTLYISFERLVMVTTEEEVLRFLLDAGKGKGRFLAWLYLLSELTESLKPEFSCVKVQVLSYIVTTPGIIEAMSLEESYGGQYQEPAQITTEPTLNQGIVFQPNYVLPITRPASGQYQTVEAEEMITLVDTQLQKAETMFWASYKRVSVDLLIKKLSQGVLVNLAD